MSQVLAILNCYCPQTGQNMGQMVFRDDGSHEFTGAQPERAHAMMLTLKKIVFPRGRQGRTVAEYASLLPKPKRIEAPRRALIRPGSAPAPQAPIVQVPANGPRIVSGGLGLDHVTMHPE